MKRIRRIGFAVTALLMLFCLMLSSSDFIIREEVAEVKKISVYVASADSPYLSDLKRGILETANESRVDVNYVTAVGSEKADILVQLKNEYEGGSQAVILFAENPEGVRQYVRQEPGYGPVITANSFGNGMPDVPDVSFDLEGAAKELADTIQREHGTEVKTVLLIGEEGISEEIGRNLKGVLEERGMEAVCRKGTEKQILQYGEEENAVFVGCWISQTEHAAEYLGQNALYGIGCSNRILNGIKEGRIVGVEAFSMYSMGIYAMQQAIAVLEQGRAADIQLSCKMITKDNMEEEEAFLTPIH